MSNDAQKAFYRTRVVKLLDTVGVLLSLAEEQANYTPQSRSRPVMPAGFRRKVGALVIETDRRKRSILAEDVAS